jgi:hypothetical protein
VRVSPRSNASGGSPIERGFGPSEGAMAQRHNADLFEVLICQISENGKIDIVFAEAVSVLPETELLKPNRKLLHFRPPTDLTRSVPEPAGQKSNTYANLLQCPDGLHVRSGSTAPDPWCSQRVRLSPDSDGIVALRQVTFRAKNDREQLQQIFANSIGIFRCH